MKKSYIFSILLGFWLYFCFHTFVVKPYFKNSRTKHFARLLSMSTEEKRAYLVGESMYEFIQFGQKVLPPKSRYAIVGMKRDDMRHRYADYYLYPHYSRLMEELDESAEYLLVYGLKEFSKEGYELFQKLDTERYILKRKSL